MIQTINVEIHLDNKYFPWTELEENNIKCWLKGNLFYNNKILQGPDIISLFSSLTFTSKSYADSLKDLVINFNGSFTFVIETPNMIIAVVDWIRSIPLFYHILRFNIYSF